MRKGWFAIEGTQDGDRTLEHQMKGLGYLWPRIHGATVVDLGAAEGLLANECVQRGAAHVHAWEVVHGHVATGRTLFADRPITFQQINLNNSAAVADAIYLLTKGWDVALMLAILHKLRDPIQFVEQFIDGWRGGLIVLRMPASTPGFVLDERSGNRKLDIDGTLKHLGYSLKHTDRGHFDEWVGFYERH